MKVAVIGGGGAGLAAARLLRADAQVTLFEREPILGGHARSVPIVVDGVTVHAETGFKYLMLPSHRRMMAWLALHGVPVRRFASSMSLIFEEEQTTLVLPPRSPGQLGRLLMNPRKLPWILAIALFRTLNRNVLSNSRWGPTQASFTHPLLPADFAKKIRAPVLRGELGRDVRGDRRVPALRCCLGRTEGHGASV